MIVLTRPLLELRYQGTAELREFVITVGIKATPLLKEWHIKAEFFLQSKDEFWNSVLFSPNGIWLRKEQCLQGTVTSPALSQTARSTQQYLQMLKLK